MISLAGFSDVVVAFAATYVLHSTVLLLACWLVIKASRTTSQFLVDRLWKVAAVLGLATAILQIGVGVSPVMEITLLAPEATHTEDALEEATSVSPLDGVRETPSSITNSLLPTESVAFAPAQSQCDAGFDVTEVCEAESLLHPMESASAMEPLFTTIERPSAATEPIYPLSIDHPAESPVLSQPDPTVAPSGRPPSVAPTVVRAASIALTMNIVVGAMLLAWHSFRFRSRFRGARVIDDGPEKKTLDRFLKRNRIRRRVRLLSSHRFPEPIAYGLIRWTIVLPESTVERLSREELKAVLAHEVAHLVRGDVRWLWVGRILCTCLSFQPLNFVARRRWQQAAEYLCDDWAVERGVHSLSLARCLAHIAEWRFGVQTCAAGLAAGGSNSTIVLRVQRLIEGQRQTDGWTNPRRRMLVNVATILCCAMLVGFAPSISLPIPIGHLQESVSEMPQSIDSTTPPPAMPRQGWESLQEELIQLEVDLDRLNLLLEDTPRLNNAQLIMTNIRQRAASLRTRRDEITSSLEKELE